MLPQLPTGREDPTHDVVLRQVVEVEEAQYGEEHAQEGEDLPVGAEQQGGEAGEVGRQRVGYVGAEDEVGVLHHEDGEEVEDDVRDGYVFEAAVDEFSGCEAATVAGLGLDGHGAYVYYAGRESHASLWSRKC